MSLVAALAMGACADAGQDGRGEGARPSARLIVFNAGSLAKPLRAALDTFALREGISFEQESAGSLESARKLTELGKRPDVIALADYEIFPQLLMPAHVSWYAPFARNRMVLAFTERSRYGSEISADNWIDVIRRNGVEVGRADPNQDPNGYRTLLTHELAERFYRRPGLADSLTAAAPQRNVRPKEADLVALVQAGEMDYIWSYESIAKGAKLRFLTLPREVDLSNPSDSALYSQAEVRVVGRTRADTLIVRGTPILYALSIPVAAPNRDLAERFVAWLLSEDGRRVLRAAELDAIATPIIVGQDVPDVIRRAADGASSR